VLTAWGSLRAWICSGHFTRGVELNEVLESLAGLPVDVEFIDFEDLRRHGVPPGVKVILNCGREGSAWSGGHYWQDALIATRLARWVQRGGGLIGIAEPSAVPDHGRYFKLAPVLGVDRDRGERIANGRFRYTPPDDPVAAHFVTTDVTAPLDFGRDVDGVYVLGRAPAVLAERDGSPRLAVHAFGKGRSVYLSGFRFTHENTRLLHRALFWAAGREEAWPVWSCSNLRTECAWFPKNRKLVVINNAATPQGTVVTLGDGTATTHVTLDAHGIKILDL
jgi:beta-D-galactosyl-(1->4)-L-rhamnose phosphorylase